MKKISIAILVLVVALASCKKTPEVNLKYVDVERDLITVGMTTATVQCDYDYIATLKKAYFYYGEGANEADMNTAEMRVVQNTLYVDLTGLRANTTYSYFYEFHNGFNSMRTALKTFKTEASPTSVILPTVVTSSVTEITTNSAKGGGEVTNDGGAEVTERGICWSTHANPTLSDNHVAAGTGAGAFTAMMNGLEANTTYHVRAYATNEVGTAYGLDREFVTDGGGSSNVPEGAINGLFTINENGDQVYFSQGNLQYQASTNTWRFAEHQWDYVGGVDEQGIEYGSVYENGNKCDNLLLSSSYNGWIDLFGWGTSGYHDMSDQFNVFYHPWNSESITINPDYNFYGYGPSTNMPSTSLIGSSANYDWGVYNAIINGGNVTNKWRTLSKEEWEYIFDFRYTNSGVRFAKSRVCGLDGVIILPDNWVSSNYNLINANVGEASFDSNEITLTVWDESFGIAGAVFLPASGVRYQMSDIFYGGREVHYWSSSDCIFIGEIEDYSGCTAFSVYVLDDSFYASGNVARDCGRSVRLVQDAH